MQFVFVVILAAGLLLALNLSGRISAGQRIQADLQKREREMVALQETQAALQQEWEWVQSQAAVDEWARGPGKMVRPGEVLVVPIPAGAAVTPTPTSPAAEQPEAVVTWRVWWNLFFDQPPPAISGG